jgi:RNA polymerase sigma-70 factor (ECF subfamily)
MCGSAEGLDLDVLLRRAAAGDAGSERALVEHFAPRVRAMALARTRDADLSRDLTQETLVALLQAFRKGQVRDHGKVAGFVAGVARNVINNHRRRTLRHPESQLDEHTPDVPAPPAEDDVDAEERRRLMTAALAALGPADREVLLLTLVDGLKPGEIATRIGVTADVARTRKSRALKRIMDVLASRSRNAAGGHLQ